MSVVVVLGKMHMMVQVVLEEGYHIKIIYLFPQEMLSRFGLVVVELTIIIILILLSILVIHHILE